MSVPAAIGRYRLVELLGEDAVRTVHLAHVDGPGGVLRSMVIERFRPEVLREGPAEDRLVQRAKVAATVTHRCVVQIYDLGKTDGAFWIASEHVDGESLEALAARAGAVPPRIGAAIGALAADGLHAAHKKGLVHERLSPRRVLVNRDGAVKVAALAVARAIGPEIEDKAGRRRRLPYLAPEQVAGGDPDARTDVFALGVVIWELTTGRALFRAETEPDTLANIAECEVPPPTSVVPGYPPELERVLLRALAKRPEDRPPTAGDLAAELRALPGGVEPAEGIGAIVRKTFSDRPSKQVTPPPPSPAQPAPVVARRPPPAGGPASYAPAPPPPPMRQRAAEIAPAPEEKAVRAPYLDENVQFTVYRPRAIAPARWYPMLAFAHLSERRPDAPPGEPDPVAEVQRQAQQVLGAEVRAYQDVTQDSRLAVPAEGELTFVPEVAGVEFNPPRRTFLWQESVHREEFRLRAVPQLEGKTARGRVSVYLGGILLAEVTISLRVEAQPSAAPAPALEPERGRVYRKIFASYSHKDVAVVAEVEKYAHALGDEFLRDWVHLRTGEVWSDRLKQLIADADVFQLFWSHNSMRSRFVRQEWEYALSLGRPSFVRPTYWEEPMPRDPVEGLPPEALLRLHFQRIHAIVSGKARAEATSSKSKRAQAPSEPAPPAAVILAEELDDAETEDSVATLARSKLEQMDADADATLEMPASASLKAAAYAPSSPPGRVPVQSAPPLPFPPPALSSSPASRPSAAALPLPPSAPPTPVLPGAPGPFAVQVAAAAEPAPRRARSGAWMALAILVALALAVALVVVVWFLA